MIHKLATGLGLIKPALVLALLPLTAGLCHAASITYSNSGVSGNLIGADTLPQFNPNLGTLTGATFQLTSVVTGNVVMTGTLSNGVCSSSTGFTVVVAVSGTNGDLNNTVNTNFIGTTGSPGSQPPCTTTSPFSLTMNSGPSAAQQALSSYIGAGTLNYTFSVSNLSNALWSGTESVTYNFNAATPEPSTAVLGLSGLLGLFALRRRYASSSK